MRKAYYILIVVSAIIFIVFCFIKIDKNGDNQINADLLCADSLMFINPDSSLAILEEIKDRSANFDLQNRALYSLLLTQARSRNNIIPDNDSIINIALNYYASSNDSIRKAWTYVYASDVNDELGEKEKALAYIQKAATTASQSGDNRLLCYIYYFWGRIIQSEKPYQDAINKIFLSEKYARALNDTFLIVSRLKDLSWSYLFLKNYTKSDSLISHALRLAYKSKRYNDLPLLYNKKSFISFEQKKYIKSLNEINKAIRYITYTSDSLKIFNRKGRILIELNQLDSARYYIEKGKNLTSFYGKAVYHNEIADIEAKNNNYKDAFVYKLRYANLLDSISEERENKSVMEYQKRYDYTQVKAENDKLKIENQQKTISLLWSAIIIILLMIGGWIVYLRFKRIMKNKINAKDKMLEDSIMMLRNKKDELFIQKQESYEKESELSSRLMNKEEELKFLQAQQHEFKEYFFKMSDVVQKIESIRTLNETQKIKSSASLALSESDFNNLMEAINLCYNDFVDRLKAEFPELSNADLYLCALLKMKVDNKDIGFLLNVSASTLKKRKYRLKADKLNSQNDDQTLDDFIEAY